MDKSSKSGIERFLHEKKQNLDFLLIFIKVLFANFAEGSAIWTEH